MIEWQSFLFGGGFLAVLTTVGAFILQWRNDRHKPDIDLDTAAAANEFKRIEASNSVTTHALTLVEALSKRVAALEQSSREVDQRNRDLAEHLEAFIAWGKDIQFRWNWWRAQTEPPPLPIQDIS